MITDEHTYPVPVTAAEAIAAAAFLAGCALGLVAGMALAHLGRAASERPGCGAALAGLLLSLAGGFTVVITLTVYGGALVVAAISAVGGAL